MFAWLVRDCITQSGDKMEETPRAALKQLEGGALKVIRVHIKKEQLMNLGASFFVGKTKLASYL